MRWPILEKVAVAALNEALEVRAGTKVPGDVDTLPGFVRVSRGPGSDDGITDSPGLDVETFAPSQMAAAELAEDCRQIIHDLQGGLAGGAFVDSVRTAVGPVRVDYSPNVERYVATYVLDFRRS
tara:strand:+ start:451 stop:822 length:372 start_codon:yes stop_codon:yes gene_type:complete